MVVSRVLSVYSKFKFLTSGLKNSGLADCFKSLYKILQRVLSRMTVLDMSDQQKLSHSLSP